MALSGYYAVDGTLGANLNNTYSTADFEEKGFRLGQTVRLNDNSAAIFVQASVIISTSAVCHLNTSFTASTSAGGFIALGSFNAGDFGWVRQSAPDLV